MQHLDSKIGISDESHNVTINELIQ